LGEWSISSTGITNTAVFLSEPSSPTEEPEQNKYEDNEIQIKTQVTSHLHIKLKVLKLNRLMQNHGNLVLLLI
jgi:hypothetical protein